MDWNKIVQTSIDVIGFIAMLPLVIAVLVILLLLVLFIISFLVKVINFIIKPTNKQISFISVLDVMESVWQFTKKVGLVIFNIIKVLLVVTIIFMFYFGVPVLDKCTSNRKEKIYNEEEIEDIVDDPKWHVPSRYRD